MSRILIVEDDPGVAEVLAVFVESMGFNASVVHDGQESLNFVEQERPDMIVLDLMLPGMTGAEAASHLRRNPPTSSIPILAITALEQVEDLEDVLMVDEVLSKPFDMHELGRSIERLLNEAATNSRATNPADV